MSPAETVRRLFAAYDARDRHAFQALMADDFRFSSPDDPDLDAAGFFERCWAGGDARRSFALNRVVEHGDEVFVRYEIERADRVRFRNLELHTTRGGRVARVEVYYGATL